MSRIPWASRNTVSPKEIGLEVAQLDSKIFQLNSRISNLNLPAASADPSFFVYNVKDYGARGDGVTDELGTLEYVAGLIADAGGGIMYFPVGTYIITAPWQVTSCPNLTIWGHGIGMSVIEQTTDNRKCLRIDTSDYVTVRDMTFKCAGTVQGSFDGTESTCLKIAACNHVLVQNCEASYGVNGGFNFTEVTDGRFVNCWGHHTSVYNGFGITFCNDVSVQGCLAHNNLGQGIEARGNVGLRIIGNTCHTNGGYDQQAGITVESEDSGEAVDDTENFVVSGNTCYSNTGAGIYLVSGTNMAYVKNGSVTGNVCRNNSTYGIFLATAVANQSSRTTRNIVISGNEVSENTLDGIFYYFCRGLNISGNHIFGNGQHGVNAQGGGAAYNRVTDNTIGENDRHGISCSTAEKYSVFSRNTIYNNSQSSAGTYHGIEMNGTGNTNNDVSGNFIFDDQTTPTQGYGIHAGLSTNCTFIGNHIHGNATAETDFLQTDNKVAENVIFDGDMLHPFPIPMAGPLRCLRGDGTNDSWYIPDDTAIDHGTGDFSRIKAIRLADYTPAAEVTIAHKADNATKIGWIWTLGTDGKQKLAIGNGTNFTTYVYTSTKAVRCSVSNPVSSLGFSATRNGNVVFMSDGAIDSEVDMSGSAAQTVNNAAVERSWQEVTGTTEYAFDEYAYVCFNKAITEEESWQKYFDGFLRYADIGASSVDIHTSSNAASTSTEANATTGWGFTRATGASVADPRTGSSGSYSIKATCNDESQTTFLATCTFTRTAGKVYRVSGYIKANQASTGFIGFRTAGGVIDSNEEDLTFTTGWTRFSVELIPNGGTGYLGIFSEDDTNGNWFEFDDIEINQVGIVAIYANDRLTTTLWEDMAGSDLDGVFDGATAVYVPAGTGTTTVGTANIQTDSVAVTAGSNAIMFPAEMADTNYIVLPRAYNASNEAMTVELSNYATTGFDCVAPENGTLEYLVISTTLSFTFSLTALQSGTTALAGGSETITLGTAMASGTYTVLPFAFDSGNAVMTVEISNLTATTFDVLAPSSGTLNYVVLA